jgi:predicted SAM-dependent methyltransferase
MTWSLETSDGNESAKIRFEILPYVRGRGVDLGCGPWKVYPHLVGVDSQAYAGGAGANVCLDVTKLDLFGDETMDCVYSSHTLEDQIDTIGTLREWWRLVKVDGYLILYLPNNEDDVANGGYPKIGEPGANPAHKWNITYDLVVDAMKQVGSWDLIDYQKRSGGNEYSLLFIFKKLANGTQELSAA